MENTTSGKTGSLLLTGLRRITVSINCLTRRGLLRSSSEAAFGSAWPARNRVDGSRPEELLNATGVLSEAGAIAILDSGCSRYLEIGRR
eukprot:1194745-Prorocentrum_minimum.AAC.4